MAELLPLNMYPLTFDATLNRIMAYFSDRALRFFLFFFCYFFCYFFSCFVIFLCFLFLYFCFILLFFFPIVFFFVIFLGGLNYGSVYAPPLATYIC